MVLFHFPPLGGVAIARNVHNVQYLPRFGWTPVVVAPQGASGLMDPGALALIPPGIRIIRASCLEPRHLRSVVVTLRSIARTPSGLGGARAESLSQGGRSTITTTETAGRDAHRAGPLRSRLWRLQRLLFFPDNQVGWLPFALVAAIRAHRSEPFDAVYSTAAPVTAHLVAGIVKRLTGVPWVAEFRDPWLGNPVTEALAGPRPWVHRRLQARLERWIVRSADRVVFVSPSTTHLYRRRYPDAAAMLTITNGHDPSETIGRSGGSVGPPRYRIVWTGTLDRPAELLMFLEAVKAVVARRPALVDRLEVVFYGYVSDACRSIADRFAGDGPLASVLRFAGFVPRQVALEALADADAALVMLGAGPGMGQFVPGKLFDYLGQNRQILAVLPPGDARDILEGLGWGVIAEPDLADIERAIEHLLTLPPPARLADPEGRYDRVALAGRLADALREATQTAQRTRGVP
jgi:glycosyltransferase involved in cell wall biosynthesis